MLVCCYPLLFSEYIERLTLLQWCYVWDNLSDCVHCIGYTLHMIQKCHYVKHDFIMCNKTDSFRIEKRVFAYRSTCFALHHLIIIKLSNWMSSNYRTVPTKNRAKICFPWLQIEHEIFELNGIFLAKQHTCYYTQNR